MEKKFIMTAIGEDRQGFVADVTRVIYEHGCNLEDSTMTKLEDEFAMIFLCSGRDEQLEEQLSRACRRLEREKGISVFLRPVERPHAKAGKTYVTRTLHVEGIDHAGIVYHVSQYLAEQQVNISNLAARLTFSPQSGTAVYTIEIRIEIPSEVSLEGLAQGLSQIGDALHVDITF